jgi:hypothetical protein
MSARTQCPFCLAHVQTKIDTGEMYKHSQGGCGRHRRRCPGSGLSKESAVVAKATGERPGPEHREVQPEDIF